MNFVCTKNTIKEKTLKEFYQSMDHVFSPALSQQVHIPNYVAKLYQHAELFEAWKDSCLVGLVACYANDTENNHSFITSVIIHPDFRKNNLATILLENCLSYLSKHHFNSVRLEVHQNNLPAQKLYQKAGFVEIGKNDNMIQMEKIL